VTVFRVPADADHPTFDDTFEVSTRKWMTSSKADRQEWERRRNLAAQTAQAGQEQRIGEWTAERSARVKAKRQAKRDAG
jgi:hypothetical protein